MTQVVNHKPLTLWAKAPQNQAPQAPQAIDLRAKLDELFRNYERMKKMREAKEVKSYTLYPTKLKKCPRCGSVVHSIRVRELPDGRKYYYAYHHGGETCYLGADMYKYVEQFNSLGLVGLYANLPEKYIHYIINLVENAKDYISELPAEQKEVAVRRLIAAMEHAISELSEILQEAGK